MTAWRRAMAADLLIGLPTTAAVILLFSALGLLPPTTSGPWWFLIIAAVLLGHVASAMTIRGAAK